MREAVRNPAPTLNPGTEDAIPAGIGENRVLTPRWATPAAVDNPSANTRF